MSQHKDHPLAAQRQLADLIGKDRFAMLTEPGTGDLLESRPMTLLEFDAQGLPSGTPGPWQPLNGTIEGFTHEAGYSSVLRVKRFNRQPVPADASAYLMVLDLVVETRIAK